MMNKTIKCLATKTLSNATRIFTGFILLFATSIHAATLVGTTKGSLSVDQGVANFTVPIKVPAGIAGMTPEISLNYASNAGNGVMGMGWSIGGLSAVYRCPSNYSQDNKIRGVRYDADDKLCLDGQRLIVVGDIPYGQDGTEYRTETDSYSKIQSFGWDGTGPEWFLVRQKGGSYLKYGNSSARDSRQYNSSGSAIQTWAVDQFTDSAGNTMYMDYQKLDGEYLVEKIRYNRITSRSRTPFGGSRLVHKDDEIYFSYEERHDKTELFQMGNSNVKTKRLSKVSVIRSNIPFREYLIKYQDVIEGMNVSSVESIQECSIEDCLPPLQFSTRNTDYTYGMFYPKVGITNEPEFDTSSDNLSQTKFGDFNGDGRTDFYVIGRGIRLAAGRVGYNEHFELAGDPGFKIGNLEKAASIDSARVKTGDFNGDGRTDFYYVRGRGGVRRDDSGNVDPTLDEIHLSEADGSFTVVNGIYTPVHGDKVFAPIDIARVKTGDFDGDGRTDIYYVRGFGNTKQDSIYLSNGNGTFRVVPGINTGVGADYSSILGVAYRVEKNGHSDISRIKFGDFDGDGRTDIYYINGSQGTTIRDDIHLSNGDGTYREIAGVKNNAGGRITEIQLDIEKLKLGDFNGDGKTDIYVVNGRGGDPITDSIYLSKGDGSYEHINGIKTFIANTVNLARFQVSRLLIADFNGDGKSDIYHIKGWWSADADKIHLSKGDGLYDVVDGPSTYISGDTGEGVAQTDIRRVIPVDFDGDGMLDIYHLNAGSDSFYNNNTRRPFLEKFENGLGSVTNVWYSPLNEDLVYTKEENATYPFVDLSGSQMVVGNIETSIGYKKTQFIFYKYAGAKIHLRGRGHLGFSSVEARNNTTFRKLVIEREQDLEDPAFPFNDSYVTSTEYLSNEIKMKDSWTWTRYVSHYPGVYAQQIHSSIEQTFDDNESLLTTISTEHLDYDQYGNVGEITTITEGGGKRFKKITQRQFYNDIGNWILSRLKSSEVTHVDENNQTITKASEFEYRSDNGWLIKETINPGTSLELTKDFHYDQFGNEISVSVSGAVEVGETARMERKIINEYSSDGRYLLHKYNSKGHKESFTHHPRCSSLETQTDSNGLTTRWEYNSLCQKTKEVRFDGTSTQWFLEWVDEPTLPDAVMLSRVSISGKSDELLYTDMFGKTLRTVKIGFDGRKIFQDIQYDRQGREIASSAPYFEGNSIFWTNSEFDDFGRIEKITTPTPHSTHTSVATTFEYDGFETTEIAADGTRKKAIKNAAGQLVRVEEEETWVEYTYNPIGALKETNANGIITKLEYDQYGNKVKMIDPSMGTWTYGNNAFGELKWQKDAKGQVVTMDYDVMGRMITRTEPEGVTTWTFDIGTMAIGKLYEVAAPNGYKEVYLYNSQLGFLEYKTVTAGTDGTYQVKTEYDDLSRVDAVTYPNGLRLTNHYNDLGFLESVQGITAQGNTTFWQVKESDASGRLTKELMGNGLSTTYNYDTGSGLLDRITTSAGIAGDIRHLEYRYDNMYNVEWRKDHHQDRQEYFVYDDLQRLTKSTTTGSFNGSAYNHVTDYQYDEKGNMTYNSDVGSYTYGSVNKGADLAGPFAMLGAGTELTGYEYDANGNATKSNGRDITWNSYNKPTAFIKDGKTTSFAYGANRARYLKVNDTSRTVYIGKAYEKITSGNEVKHKNFIYAGGKVVAIHETSSKAGAAQPESTHYLHTDNLGSTDTVTNAAGVVVERMGYAVFGERRLSDWRVASTAVIPDSTNRGYTGHEHIDEVGLIHMNGRVYDPKAGRFLSADPHIQDGKSSQSYNRYSYVMNNPMKYTDPSGFFWKKTKKHLSRINAGLKRYSGRDAISKYIKSHAWAQQVIVFGSNLIPGLGPFISAGFSVYFARENGATSQQYTRAGIMSLASSGFKVVGTQIVVKAKLQILEEALLHAVMQGALAEASGGDGGKAALIAFGGTLLEGSSLEKGEISAQNQQDAMLISGFDQTDIKEGAVIDGHTLEKIYLSDDVLHDGSDNGFRAGLFVNGESRILVMEGTTFTSPKDWFANIKQAFGFDSGQYKAGIALSGHLASSGTNLRIIGHSLGGGIASASAILTGTEAATYNAAGLNSNTLRGVSASNGVVTSYTSSIDVVQLTNVFTSLPGAHVSLGRAGWHPFASVCVAMEVAC